MIGDTPPPSPPPAAAPLPDTEPPRARASSTASSGSSGSLFSDMHDVLSSPPAQALPDDYVQRTHLTNDILSHVRGHTRPFAGESGARASPHLGAIAHCAAASFALALRDTIWAYRYVDGYLATLAALPRETRAGALALFDADADAAAPLAAAALVPSDLRWTAVVDLTVYAVFHSNSYDARARVGIRRLAVHFAVPPQHLDELEDMLAREVCRDRPGAEGGGQASTGRTWKLTTAAVVGGLAMGIAGPAALPAVGWAFQSVGLATIGAGVASASGTLAATALFGAAGIGLGHYKMDKRTAGVKEFSFEHLHGDGMSVLVAVSGWLQTDNGGTSDSDLHVAYNAQWAPLAATGDLYMLKWESRCLAELGTATKSFHQRQIQSATATTLVQYSNAAVASAIAWPSAILSLANLVDNPWLIAIDRAEKAGRLLAQVLLDRVAGSRPVSLIGFSTGARVIYYCLLEMTKSDDIEKARGIVCDVTLLGSPIPINPDEWRAIRELVAGRLVNGYTTNDWVLRFVHRSLNSGAGIAGLQSIDCDGVENLDLTDAVPGHLSYPDALAEIQGRLG